MRKGLVVALGLSKASVPFYVTNVLKHVLGAVIIISAGSACADDYPNKPIRIITSAIGGGTDRAARLIAQGLTANAGWSVIIDNRPTLVAIDTAVKAQPDGYNLLVSGPTLWVSPFLQKTDYDPIRDFVPITMTDGSPGVLIVNPSVPVKSVQELIALAKAKPGTINYSSPAPGSGGQLSAELLNSMAGIKLVRVSYRSVEQGMIGLLAGDTQVAIAFTGFASPQISSGKVRALAVTSSQPSRLYPGLPTIASAGLPGFEAVNYQAVFGPAKIPAMPIKRLNEEIVRVLNQSDVKDKFLQAGSESIPSSPEQAAATIKTDMNRWSKVIKDADIHAE